MTRPCRRITLHLSQIFLTLGLTFTVCAQSLLVPVDDATAGQVVGRELHDDAVLRQDADVVLAHLAADVGENAVPVGELDAEHGVRQRLDDPALDLDGPFFLGHVLHIFGTRIAGGEPGHAKLPAPGPKEQSTSPAPRSSNGPGTGPRSPAWREPRVSPP